MKTNKNYSIGMDIGVNKDVSVFTKPQVRPEPKFTKGEWVFSDILRRLVVTNGKKGFVIAEVTNQEVERFIGNEQEAQANAKLIAASPELLETLVKLTEAVSPMIYKLGTKKGFSELVALEAAKKAIRRAAL